MEQSQLPSIDGYNMIEFLGEGKMGMVYKAQHLQNQNIVAIKAFKEDLKADVKKLVRFKKEGDILVKLNHKNIINASDSGEQDGLHFYAMEVVIGKDLKEKCDEIGGPIDPKWAMFYCYQSAAALQYLNFNGVIHRDLKPANIMVGYDHRVKVCDLSFARTDEYDDLLAKEGCTVGTPNYMSPELARAEDKIDIQTDIYSLGASIYYCLCNASPFTGKTPQEVMTRHCEDPLVPPHVRNPNVPEAISNIVCKMMAKTREERYQEPVELLRDIRQVINVKEMEEQAESQKQTPCPSCGTINDASAGECYNCFHDLLGMQSVGLKLFDDEIKCPLCDGVVSSEQTSCPHCGVLVCPSCSDAVMPGEVECLSCNSRLDLGGSSASQGALPQIGDDGNEVKSGGPSSTQKKVAQKQKAEAEEGLPIMKIIGGVVVLSILFIVFTQSNKPPARRTYSNNNGATNTSGSQKNNLPNNIKDGSIEKAEALIRQIPALDERLSTLKASIDTNGSRIEEELKEIETLFSDSKGQLSEEARLEYENHIKELSEKVAAKTKEMKAKPTPVQMAQEAFKEAEKAFSEQRYGDAKKFSEEALSHNPKLRQAYDKLLAIAKKRNNKTEIIASLKNLKQHFSLTQSQHLLLADTYFEKGNYEEALKAYEIAKVSFKDSRRGEQVIECMLKANQVSQLVEAYQELAKDRTKGKIYQAKLVRILEKSEDTDLFLAQLTALEEKDPTFYDLPYYNLLKDSLNNSLTSEKVDRLTLKDGTIQEGKIVKEQKQYITFKDEDGKQSILYPKDIQKTEKEVLSITDQKIIDYLKIRQKGDLEEVLDYCLAQNIPELEPYLVSAAVALIHDNGGHSKAQTALEKLNYIKLEKGYMPSTAKEFQSVINKLKKNDLKGTLPNLENILKIKPNHPEASFLMALMLFEEKKHKKTASAFKKLKKKLKGNYLVPHIKEAIASAESLYQKDCKSCKGQPTNCTKCKRGKASKKCKKCKGIGKIGSKQCKTCLGRKMIETECRRCKGTGIAECKKCGLAGRLTLPQKKDARGFYSHLLRKWTVNTDDLGKVSLKYD